MMFLGLGDAAADLQAAIDGFLLRAPDPSSSDVVSFLTPFPPGPQRDRAAQALIARGVKPGSVSGALTWLATAGKIQPSAVWGALALVSGAASAFHGYRRNQSIGWGLAWFVLGTLFPIVTPVIAVAQGYGQRKA